MSRTTHELATHLWSITNLLRGSMRPSEYQGVIAPLTVLRRMDCLRRSASLRADGGDQNTTPSIFTTDEGIGASPLSEQLLNFALGFSDEVTAIVRGFELPATVNRLASSDWLLRQVLNAFSNVDLGPTAVSDSEIGEIFDDLIGLLRRANPDRWAEHHTPRDLSDLIASLLITAGPLPAASGGIMRVYDPLCGSGGLLSAMEHRIHRVRGSQEVKLFGQDINPESCALSRARMLLRGKEPGAIEKGNTLTVDRHPDRKFDFLAAVTPFGGDWRTVREEVTAEAKKGPDGRFEAGLPRVQDASLLFLQHMVSHMRLPEHGGARTGVVFSQSPLTSGPTGSGESRIRQWIIDHDLVEGIIALPAELLPNTSMTSYLWLLNNVKDPSGRRHIVFLDARAYSDGRHLSQRTHDRRLTEQQVDDITRLYRTATSGSQDRAESAQGTAYRVPALACGYREFTVERPLRQVFAVRAASVTALEKRLRQHSYPQKGALVAALGKLQGHVWKTREAFRQELGSMLKTLRATPEFPFSVWKAVLRETGVSDTSGEKQTNDDGSPRPDPQLSFQERVPLGSDVDTYIRDNIAVEFPDAWANSESIAEGYEFPDELFRYGRWREGFGAMSRVAARPSRSPLSAFETDEVRVLNANNLYTARTASELPEVDSNGNRNIVWSRCSGGDIAGLGKRWRVLPPGFGEALTTLEVLRPHRKNTGEALCEWLRSQELGSPANRGRVTKDLRVPVTVLQDPDFNALLSDMKQGRETLGSLSGMIPNVFGHTQDHPASSLSIAPAVSARARLLTQLTEPLEDPYWLAEWGFPYPVATLARQVRVNRASAERRKDALLKLSESIARTLGVMAAAILNSSEEKLRPELRDGYFGKAGGATFGTWNKIVRDLAGTDAASALPNLGDLTAPEGPLEQLDKVRKLRNRFSHEHGVRAPHELDSEINELEPEVIQLLKSVSWLSDLSWDWGERCEYTGTDHRLVGRRLRGAHPDWEPFEGPPEGPLHPDRVYARHRAADAPLSLWPFVTVKVCTTCHSLEPFVLNRAEVRDGTTLLTLRSGRDHKDELSLETPDP